MSDSDFDFPCSQDWREWYASDVGRVWYDKAHPRRPQEKLKAQIKETPRERIGERLCERKERK